MTKPQGPPHLATPAAITRLAAQEEWHEVVERSLPSQSEALEAARRSPWEDAPRLPLSMREERANAFETHMEGHEGKLLTECANGEFTLTYSWAGDDGWRGARDQDGRAVVQARSADLLGTMQCVIAQVEHGIEFHPFDSGLADFRDPAVHAAATNYYAGPAHELAAELYGEEDKAVEDRDAAKYFNPRLSCRFDEGVELSDSRILDWDDANDYASEKRDDDHGLEL